VATIVESILARSYASLAVASTKLLSAFGPGLALAVLTAMAVSMTLGPALMAIFGGLLFRPVPRWPRRTRGGRWNLRTRAARFAATRPIALLIAVAGNSIGSVFADLGRVALAIMAVTLVLLLFLRSLLAPAYLPAAGVLAVFATLGLTILIARSVLGYGSLVYFVPFAAGVLLVSLGSDYNVFVVGRIWEKARRRPVADAASRAGRRSALTVPFQDRQPGRHGRDAGPVFVDVEGSRLDGGHVPPVAERGPELVLADPARSPGSRLAVAEAG